MPELTDADLNRLIAEKVMGWKVEAYASTRGVRTQYYHSVYGSAYLSRPLDVEDWGPTHSYDDAGAALARLMKHEIEVSTLYNEDSHLWTVNILPVRKPWWPMAIGLASELPKALTIAMLELTRLRGEWDEDDG